MKTDHCNKRYSFADFIVDVVETLIITVSVLMLFSGCTTKIVEKPVFIETKCPKLQTYDALPPFKLHAYNRNDKVCIKEWDNSCIPKQSFKELVEYVKSLRGVIDKYQMEIDIYSKNYIKKARETK